MAPRQPAETPSAPRGLTAAGRKVWRAVWPAAPWVNPELDSAAVEALCRLIDEAAGYQRLLTEHGPLLEEPIVTPRGDVVGKRLVANPAEGMLRRAQARIEKLTGSLGLDPASRARLGLSLVELQKTQSKLEALIARRSGMPR